MNNSKAKALRVIAYQTVFQNPRPGIHRRYYQYLKKRYNSTPRKDRHVFFEGFTRV